MFQRWAGLSGPLSVATGGISLLATCFLPSEPKTPRILFILKDTVQIAVASREKPAIGVKADAESLPKARVQLESRDTSIATTDTAGNVVARRRGVAAIRVVLVSGAIGTTAPETTFAVRVIVSRLVLPRSTDSLFSLGDTLLFRPGYRDANSAPLSAADSAAVKPRFTLVSTGRAVTLDTATGAVVAKANGTDTVRATADTSSISLVVGVRQRAIALALASGNAQSDTIGGTLPAPIAVTPTDTHGNPVPGFAVRFAVTGGGGSLSDTVKSTDASGLAGSRWTLGGALGTNSALAFASGLTGSPVSFTATATPAHASPTASLITVSRSTIQSGETATLTLQAKDASGNNETTGGLTVVFGASGSTSAGTISPTTDRGDGTYTATFTGTTAGSATTIGASIGGNPVTSPLPNITVTPGTAAKLAFTVQPSNATAGAAITPAVQVAVQDAAGNSVPGTTNAITLAITIGANPGGATLFGTVTKSAANGVASFADLRLDKVGTGYTLSASGTSLAGVTSSAFNITPGAASKLAFAVQPSNATAGKVLTPAVQVVVQDAFGNTVTGATNAVTLALGSNPGGATLSGLTTVSVVNGVASFTDLSLNKAGSAYTLAATSTGPTGVTSGAFDITATAASKVAFTVQPNSATAGQAITPAVQLSIQDAFGNTVTTSTDAVTLAIGTNPSGGTLSGTLSKGAVSGVAAFADLTIDKAGSGYTLTASAGTLAGATSVPINVTAAVAVSTTNSTASASPGTGVVANGTATSTITVTVRDAGGSPVTGQTVQLSATGTGNSITQPAATSNASGVATGAIASTVAGIKTITVTVNPGVGQTVLSAQPTVEFVAPVASKLAFTVQPSNATAGAAIAPAIQVTIQDASGNTITTATNAVTVGLGTNPSGGTLFGTLTKSAVNGVATFSDLSIDKVGTGYTLTAAATALTAATSTGFNITPAAAKQLAFTVQPSSVTAGVSIAPAVNVTIQDSLGNTVTGATNAVTLSIGTNPAVGSLLGMRTVNAVNGMATFSDLSIDKAGTGYTLTASSSLLTGATSAAFNVGVAAPSKLAFTVQPSSATAGVAIAPAVQAAVQDAFGNTVPNATDAVTVVIGTNAGGGTLSGTATQNPVNGVASFANLSIDKAGTGYTLSASSGTLAGAASTAFNITPAAAAKLAFTVQPTNAAAGAAITPAVQVSIQDAFGNTVPGATNAVTVAIGSNPGSGTLSGTLTQNPTNGVASFGNLSIDKTGTGYTLTAAAIGLTGMTSTTFNITPGPAAQLVFTVQPGNARANSSITPAVQVTAQDAFGNNATGFTGNVKVAIGTDASAVKNAKLSGTTSVAAVAGVAVFSDLSIDQIGVGYTLTAAFGTAPPIATSGTFTILP